ncbi:MAG: circadian clock protein KaiC [Gemmatimonadaceae bacterium]
MHHIAKDATGIAGFDELTRGGLPQGRVTLVVGGPGAGKTIFALESMVYGASELGEPGIFVAFEENSRQIIDNAATFDWDLPGLEQKKVFFLDARLSPSVVQAGTFDLNLVLAGLAAKVEEMSAKRIVFDGIDVLLGLLDDPVAERREVYRIYEWLQQHKLTGIITAKASEADRPSTERYAFMQFMVDCVVLMQARLSDRVSLRGIRIMKYRGSGFAEGEFPMIISADGIEVSAFGTAELTQPASTDRISSGVERLDTMLDGGYYRGSGVLISGSPGTAKTTLAGAFVAAAAARGEHSLFVSFDEPAPQILRNLASVGLDLARYVKDGMLTMHSIRSEAKSAEEHLLELERRVTETGAQHIVVDPISALAKAGGHVAAIHASLRLIDFAKEQGLTILCTSLVASDDPVSESTSTQISTLADTWIHLSYLIHGGERNRALTIVKSRGMKHSNQVRELVLTREGITITDVYSAGGEVLAGTARWEKEAELREQTRREQAEAERRRIALRAAEAEFAARLQALEAERDARLAELAAAEEEYEFIAARQKAGESDRVRLRGGDAETTRPEPTSKRRREV